MNIETVKTHLRKSEGLELKPYDCPAGYLTIGYGRNLQTNGLSYHEMLSLISSNPERKKRLWHLIDTVSGAKLTTEVIRDFFKHGITKDEAEWLMCNDIDTAIKQLKTNLIWFEDAHPEIQEVLIDMCFNMGINTLMTFTTTLKLMSLHQYPEAAEQMLKSKWAKQVKRRAKGLSERVKNIK